MPRSETLNTRVTRLEQLHADMAEKMNALIEAQTRHELAANEREYRMDERIGKLVSAIGVLIGQMQKQHS